MKLTIPNKNVDSQTNQNKWSGLDWYFAINRIYNKSINHLIDFFHVYFENQFVLDLWFTGTSHTLYHFIVNISAIYLCISHQRCRFSIQDFL